MKEVFTTPVLIVLALVIPVALVLLISGIGKVWSCLETKFDSLPSEKAEEVQKRSREEI